jgi:hypothetical protein
MTEIITKSYLINGPNNVVRLTDGKKILYIFGDNHLDPTLQSECPFSDKLETIDIDKFMSLFIKTEKKQQFDMFAEMYSDKMHNRFYPQRYRYIDGWAKLFQSKIKKSDKTVKINPLYPNFRFHYMDMRDSIPLFESIFFSYEMFDLEKMLVQDIKKQLTYLRNLIYDFENYLEKGSNRYINKILNKYSDRKIKETITHIYDSIILYNLENVKKLIDEVLSIKKNGRPDTIMKRKMNNIFNINLQTFVVMTDLFFLRRFLDKNYISNGILYTGLYHMVDIMYILVNYFGYKVTHTYYEGNTDNYDKMFDLPIKNYTYIMMPTENLTQTIGKNVDKDDKKNTIIGPLHQTIPYQCVDLLKFPPNFT